MICELDEEGLVRWYDEEFDYIHDIVWERYWDRQTDCVWMILN